MKINNNKGITIVALVITIILMLILAGISIQAMTGTGIFESAKRAELENKRAQVSEYLNLKLLTQQMLNSTGSAEEIIKATREDVNKNISELKEIGKEVTVEETSTEEDGEEVDIYFYVIVDKDVYKVSLKGVEFIGEQGKFPPIIKIESATSTTNSITVQVKTWRNQGGKIKYYIKSEDEEKYTEKETTTEETYTYTELEQNKTYSIKIEAIAENKQTAEVTKDITVGSVPNIEEGDIIFTYTVDGTEINKETWTNKTVTVTATLNTDITGYKLQTSKDGKNWENTASQVFTENGKIYVSLYDGKNYGGSATGNVTNIDKLAPKDFTPTATSTTNSLTVTVSATDADATTAYGKSGIAGYRFKLDSGSWTNYQTSGTYTWNSLTQTTNHTITVEAKDNAGNTKQGTVSKGTGTVTDLTEANVTFTYSPSGWTNKDVTATVSTTVTGYTLQTSKDGTTWESKTSQTYSSNGYIYARLWDGTNFGGSATGNFTNIDKTAPKVTGATATTNKITITATDEASGIVGYAVTTTNTAPTEFTSVTSTKTLSVAPTGYKQGTTYYVWVKDKAGNVSESKSTATGKVTDLTTANVTFTYSPSDWTNKDVTATVSTTVTGYTLQTSKDGTTWESKTSQTYSSNGYIYARLWDGTNFGGSATGNFTNIDKTAPKVTGATATTNKITITATDEASGIVGYAVTTTNTAPTEFTSVTSTKTLSVAPTGYKQGTTYYVWVKDKAGNVSASKSAETGTVTKLEQGDVIFTYAPNTWTNGSVKVTAAFKEGFTSNYTLKITETAPSTTTNKQTALNWANASEGITTTTNKTIYAVLVDNEGQTGGAVTGTVNNIDTQKPVVTVTDSTTNSITFTGSDTAKSGESASGIEGYIVQESNTTPSANANWISYNGESKTVSGLTQGKTYYVFVKDKAGNISEGKTKTTDIIVTPNVTFAYDPNDWTNGSVKVTATLTDQTSTHTLKLTENSPAGASKSTALSWTNASTGITVTTNKIIYAVLVDNEGQIGTAVIGNVTNIDKLAPKYFTPTATSTTNSITVTAVAQDADATTAYGKSGIAGYRFKLDSGDWTNYQTSGTYTWNNLAQTTNYTITVEAKDNAGNTKQGAVSKGTETVTVITKANTTFTSKPNGWTNGSVTSTVSTIVTGFTLQTSINGKDWLNETSQIFTENGTIYARLWDGTNTSPALSENVTNIDKTAPTISTALKSTATGIDSVTLSVGITDENSGLGKIEWYYGTTNNPTTKVGTTEVTTLNGIQKGPTTAQTKAYTVTGLSAGTIYYFKAIIYDVAGNQTTSSVISAKTQNPTAADISYTPSDSSWKVDNVKSALDYLYNR